MTKPPRETRVLGAVVSLVDSMLDDFDVVDLLTDLTERCAELLDIEAAGLLLADPRGHLHVMASTSGRSRELDLFQRQADEGPCLDCYLSGQPVSVVDLSQTQHKWPKFASAATDAGFSSVHAVPMRAAGTVLGALGLFGTTTGDMTDADMLVAQSLAHIACVAILQDHAPAPDAVPPRLQVALLNRIAVEQAKGYLRQHFDITTEDAFRILRQYARNHGTHLTDVSANLIREPGACHTILTTMERTATVPRAP